MNVPLFFLQFLEFSLCHLFQCLVERGEQKRQGLQKIDQLRKVFEFTSFVSFCTDRE